MRAYIFSKREEEVLKAFLEQGVKLAGYRDLKHLIKKNRDSVERHVELMRLAAEKMGIE